MSYDLESHENNAAPLAVHNGNALSRLNKINRTKEKTNFDRTLENLRCRPTVEIHNQFEEAFDYADQRLFYPHFSVHLPHVIFTTPKSVRFMGYFIRNLWNKETEANTKASEIALNPLFFKDPLETCKTLVHEMVHLAQAEYPHVLGKPGKGGYHNKAFAYAMIRIGLMPSSTGREGGAMTGVRMSEYIIPGGPFDVAFKEYLSKGDKFVWSLDLNRFGAAGEQTKGDGEGGRESLTQDSNAVSERKRRSKTRYTCPACALNAWAKPNVQLICGKCSTSLTETRP